MFISWCLVLLLASFGFSGTHSHGAAEGLSKVGSAPTQNRNSGNNLRADKNAAEENFKSNNLRNKNNNGNEYHNHYIGYWAYDLRSCYNVMTNLRQLFKSFHETINNMMLTPRALHTAATNTDKSEAQRRNAGAMNNFVKLEEKMKKNSL